ASILLVAGMLFLFPTPAAFSQTRDSRVVAVVDINDMIINP
ncbi:unnamed protein product, partial [marine sediment metagenome]